MDNFQRFEKIKGRMKKYFGLYFMYLAYLLILGQGCSAIDGVDHVVSVPLPSLINAPSISFKEVSDITFTQAPKKETTVSPSPVLTASLPKKSLERKSLPLKVIKKPAPIETLKPIQKSFEVDVQKPAFEEKPIVEVSKNIETKALEKEELSYRTGITHYGFVNTQNTVLVSWSESLGRNLEKTLAKIEERSLEIEAQRIANEESGVEVQVDKVTNIQSSPEKTVNQYDPSDPKMLAMFERPQVDLNEIINKKAETTETKPNDNELVLIDYSKSEQGENEKLNLSQTGLAQVAASPISSAVSRVIQREMGPEGSNLNKALLAMNKRAPRRSKERTRQKVEHQDELKNSLGLYALEASLNEGYKGEVTNFSFVPSYDTNESIEDYGEGFITIDYSLQNATGVLRGTLLKNYYIRTSFELPLGSEYSKFEIPMITQDSIVDYLDQHNLEGYGGYYLADLGEYLEDVELEKGSKGYQNTYEHRLLLDENFKKVEEGRNYRYVLFIGVTPGNVTVRYLGVNGQETSKITFIAPDELLYDFSQLERPLELSVKTTLQNTLGRKPTNLSVEPSKFINFLSGEKANQVGPFEYGLKTPWKIKGARSYFELAYLQDSIFVGIDGNKTLELPSREFIGETLQAFNMDGLNKECLLQINFTTKIRDVKILGESARGPAVFDMAYLDEDGVFSAELSPISKKVFLLGNEDGIFNIKVTYENGNEDYLRTYCSTSSYLLEQL